MDEKRNHDSAPFYVQIWCAVFTRQGDFPIIFGKVFLFLLFWWKVTRTVRQQREQTRLEMTKSGSELSVYVFVLLLLCIAPRLPAFILRCSERSEEVKWVGKSIINQTEHATTVHIYFCGDGNRLGAL